MEHRPRIPPEGINVTPTHPLRELLTLVLGVGGIALGVTLLAGWLAESWIVHVPPRLEERLFGALWSEADAQGGEPAPAELAALLESLAGHWPDNPYALRLRVLPETEPNAFAAPGGVVLVTRGLLEAVESENELAFVLGHEIGHFQGRDHLRGLGRGLVWSVAWSALAGSAGGGETLPLLVSQLAATRFQRDHEQAADRFGLALVAREYGHVAGADRFFRRLAAEHGRDASARLGRRLGSYLATHPLDEDRIEALADEARRAGWPRHGALEAWPGSP